MKFIALFLAMLVLSSSKVNSQTHYSLINFVSKHKNGKGEVHGYLNNLGQITYEEKPDESIRALAEGLGVIKRQGKYGFIDPFGNIVIPLMYDDAESFSEGLAAVKLNGKWGYINKKNELIIAHKLISCKPFKNKVAYYIDENALKNNLFKYIDTTGNFINSEDYLIGNDFSDNCAWVKDKKTKDWGCINTRGEYIIAPKYHRVTPFKNGRCWVQTGDKWGYINKKGEYIIEPSFHDTNNELNGYTWVEKYNVWGLLDSTGKTVLTPSSKNETTYALKSVFSYVKLSTPSQGVMVFNAGSKSGYQDLTFKEVIPPIYDEATNFVDGVAIVKLKGKYGMIDLTGKLICDYKFKQIKYLEHGVYCSGEGNDNVIIFDKTGKLLSPDNFIRVRKFE